jgi:alpha-galactosidase
MKRALILALIAAATLGLLQSATSANAGITIREGLYRVAQTPPMGWDSYGYGNLNVTARDVEQEADAMVSKGMKAAGYRYVIIDAGWDLPTRPGGRLTPDPAKFPNGIKAVANYVHRLGLEIGIYSTVGPTTCRHEYAGSFGHYRQDADRFASWGVDYVKIDQCTAGETGQSAQALFSRFGRALAAAGRKYHHPMVYSISTNRPAIARPTAWAPDVGNLWRTWTDVRRYWYAHVNGWDQGVFSNFRANVAPGMARLAGPGHWNDPDLLQIGNGRLTPNESRAQFSLWAEMASPLIAGNHLTTMSKQTQAFLTNRAVIAVDQDPLGKQGRVITSAGGRWVITKPLADGARAVVLFNAGNTPATITTTTGAVGLPRAATYHVTDLWHHTCTTIKRGRITATVGVHDVQMLRISAA